MKNTYILFLLLTTLSFAQSQDSAADCLILEDENSIICKYSHERVAHEQIVEFHWIEPDGTISRERDMLIPASHGSVYDYRYIKGRTKGIWTFKVIDGQNEYKTNFAID